jgi:hypothetical protein
MKVVISVVVGLGVAALGWFVTKLTVGARYVDTGGPLTSGDVVKQSLFWVVSGLLGFAAGWYFYAQMSKHR